jgi:rare lipoprotein A (peptidoglycan hydrolase)
MRYLKKQIWLSFFLLFWSGGTINANFADVDVTHPHFLAITSLQSQKVIKGYSYQNMDFFKPLKPVLRAEAMKMLVLGSDIEITTEGGFFSDVPNDQWFAPFVNTAAKKNIVSGFADGNFHPAAQVSRAEFLKMVLLGFGDSIRTAEENEGWHTPFIERAQELNIISSEEGDPYHSLTRGELAEILYRTKHIAKTNFQSRYVYSGSGKASYYNEGFAGKLTASGEIYDPSDLTAAHRTLPFGTYVKISFEEKYVIVRINDRGPYHNDRIFDLSERSFTELAPISRGIISVHFEVVSGPNEKKAAIPEYIRSEISTETKNEPIPEIIAETLTDTSSDKSHRTTIPLFDETVPHLPKSFFSNAVLRKTVPQKIPAGTIFNFSGTAHDRGWHKATVFLQKLSSSEKGDQSWQTHFSDDVSGKNFSFSVAFLYPGKYLIGLVFDDQKKSRVGEIEVIPRVKKRYYPASEISFSSDLDVHIIPEDSLVRFDWTSKPETISKITFSQNRKEKHLFIEDALTSIEIPYSFFHSFISGKPLLITLSQALSHNQTLGNQTTNWKQAFQKKYEFVEGFPDTESNDISISSFPRFVRTLEPITLKGRLKNDTKQLSKNAFLTMPNGLVKEFPIQKRGMHDFRVRITPETWGKYVFEIITDGGEILFNRALYFSPDLVFPIGKQSSTPLANESVAGIRHWTNVFRQDHGIASLSASTQLNEFAQKYAEQMANENFISHTTPTGLTFKKRLKLAELQGEFGENLGFASSLELALAGLQNSASHRKNMLRRTWKKVGIGFTQNYKGQYYVVQLFGK